MENASKALIIAGAILVSILIIGLGMYLYTTASGVFDSNQLKEQQARTYNDQFEKYFGSKVTGSNVSTLWCSKKPQYNKPKRYIFNYNN